MSRMIAQPKASSAVHRQVAARRKCTPLSTRHRKGLSVVDAAVLNTPSAADSPARSEGFVSKDQAVLLQGFGWDSSKNSQWYQVVRSKIQDMKACGVTHVWLPPPSQSVSTQGYLPSQLYNLNSRYGTQEQLQQLVGDLRASGIAPVADIVINHRCADAQDEQGIWNKYWDLPDHPGTRIDWDKNDIAGTDSTYRGRGSPDTGEDYAAAPDLDHQNAELRAGLKDWLNWLKGTIGFTGWRFDFVKGYGAKFIDEYVESTVGKDAFCVGEYWTDMRWDGPGNMATDQNAARQKLCDWMDANMQSSTAFDFPTKGILQEACRNTQYYRLRDNNGKAPGLIGWWPAMAVTFVDNHDTGSTQQMWPFPSDRVTQGYAYILTHPGIPCIFWEHLFDWGFEVHATINDLVALRKRNKITSNSKLDIKAAYNDLYVAVIDNRVTVKLGPRFDMGDLVPRDGWKLAVYGKDFAVWERI